MNGFNGVKVFSATKAQERELLGEKITAWIRNNPNCVVVDKQITQSSDEAFHCLAITLFYNEEVDGKVASNGNRADRDREASGGGQSTQARAR